ncbi:hypothetical protein OGATHE_003488 [Ogataea polymorpha]|uniref:PH domain-containing protein n=1 Tax=Ogataea polymorpha TaxID=460523 RepID=A0A9P8P2L8_9ASCO|nr:hypothetical protein OGATHE_003488 [Ogataea polymorpha]
MNLNLPPWYNPSLGQTSRSILIGFASSYLMFIPGISSYSCLGAQSLSERRPLSGNDFLSDLSDGLLVESRRLNHENTQLKAQLSDLQDKYTQTSQQLHNLQVLNKKLSEKEEDSSERIWELESQLSDLRDNSVKLQQMYEKTSKDKSSRDVELESLRAQLELYQEKQMVLEKETTAKLSQLNATIKELKERNSDLNDENDELHQKVHKLSVSENKRLDVPPANDENAEYERYDESLLLDPSLSPIREISQNTMLESDTASLQKAQKTIAKLKQDLAKLKAEKDELKRKQTKSPKKSTRRQSVAESDEWDDFDKSIAANTTARDSEYSNLQMLEDELGNLSDEYDEMETSQIKYLEKYASKHGLKLVPESGDKTSDRSIIEASTGYDIVALPNDANVHSPIEQLKQRCHELDMVPLKTSEYEELVKRSNYDTIDTDKLANVGLTVLPLLEFKALEGKANKFETAEAEIKQLQDQLENPGAQFIHKKANDLGLATIPAEEFEKLKAALNTKTIELNTVQEKLRQVEKRLETQVTSLEQLQSGAKNHNMDLLPAAEHRELLAKVKEQQQDIEVFKGALKAAEDKLASPDVSYIKEMAAKKNLVILTVEENEALKAVSTPVNSPVKRNIDSGSPIKRPATLATDGTVEIAAAALRSLQQTVENPTLPYLSSKLSNLGYKALSINEYELLVAKSSSSGVNVSPRKQRALESAETVESLKRRCAERGLVVLSKSSYESILVSSKRSLTPVELLERVDKSGMVALKKKDYQELLETVGSLGPQFEEPVKQMKRAGPQHIGAHLNELKLLADQQAKVSASYDSPPVSFLMQKARDAGYKLLSEKEYKERKVEPSAEECREILEKHNLVLLDPEEHKELLLLKNSAEHPSKDFVSKLAAAAGLSVMETVEAKRLSNPSKSQVVQLAKQYSLVMLDKQEHEKLHQELKKSKDAVSERNQQVAKLDSQVKQLQDRINRPTVEFLQSAAARLNFVLVAKNENDKKENQLKVTSKLEQEVSKLKSQVSKLSAKLKETETSDFARSQAAKFDLVVMTVSEKKQKDDELGHCQKQLSEKSRVLQTVQKQVQELTKQLTATRKELDLEKQVSPSLEVAKSVVTKSGLLCLSKEEVDHLSQAKPRETVYVDAPSEPVDSKDRTMKEEELKEHASKLGFVLVPVGQKRQTQRLDVHKLKELAKLHGLETIEASKLRKLEENSKIDLPTLHASARSLGMTVVDPKAAPKRADLSQAASKLGLKLMSSSEIEALRKRPITSKDLAAKAAELKLKLVPENEQGNLKNPVLDSDLKQICKSKGYMLIPESKFVATTVSRTVDESNIVVVPSTYYNKLIRSHAWYKNHKTEVDESEKPATTVLEEDEPSVLSADVIKQSQPSISMNHLARHATTSTVQTTATSKFTDQEMIAAITQTIIGEYLYKYYRKLGPLSSLSEARHERYFWIHPYSLTLYWSAANPILGDPSENKIRALAISRVESVEDNNPLPPGLYHKSILVHSVDRTIKITCPTQKRHRIWFNSLRYLIDRSVDENINQDPENQYEVSYALDDRVENERNGHGQPPSRSLTTKGLFGSIMPAKKD